MVSSNLLKVGQYFIHLSKLKKSPITNKKLQKLVYYAQAWSLVLRDKQLFKDDIEAWVHGPAVRALYGQYKRYGFSFIDEDVDVEYIKTLSADVKNLLDNVWKVYGKFDAGYLEILTHSEKPWQLARAGLESHQSSGNIISAESMKSFYSQKLSKSQHSK